MKYALTATALVVASAIAFAVDGQNGIHDPSTIVVDNGKYYTYGTGGGTLVSDDGWTWRRGTTPGRSGMAPDAIKIGDRYYLYIARNVGAQPKAEINMIWSKSLDPASPDYKWEEGGIVAATDGIEDCNGIDPGVFLDPNDGRLWMVYGSYFGYIRQVELDPKTGKRLNPNDKPRDLAINCEASIMIFREGWYYLLATHGSCCRGADSGYNIRMGRSRKVTGPFLDHTGLDMIQGGGKLFLTSTSRFIGAGHFGLLDLGQGVQKFSMHWEADLEKGGASVLDIRPLQWKDGWPAAGQNMKDGTYEMESARTGTVLEMAVEGVPVGGARGGRGGRGGGPGAGPGGPGGPGAGGRAAGAPVPGAAPAGAMGPGPGPQAAGPGAGGRAGAGAPGRGGAGPGGGGGMFGGTGVPIPPQEASQVATNWPAGPVGTRMSNFMSQAQQKWAIAAVPNAGGYPGSPYFKITIAGTERALAATEEAELAVVPAFTGAPEQLWRFDQMADGSWRVMPKAVPNSKEALVLSAVGSSFATLAKPDPASDMQRWNVKLP
jgi:arabinan endo-1,5-alpha-L-arabinosidase